MAENKIIEEKRNEMVELILSSIENNKLNWQKGWVGISKGQMNGFTQKNYRGINALFLAFLSVKKGYTDTRWVTFNQAKELGASVKKGEKSASILFFERYDTKTKKEFDARTIQDLTEDEQKDYIKENVYTVTKYSYVFNAEQCSNFPALEKPLENNATERANQNEIIERIIANSQAPIRYDGGNEAYYNTESDSIHLPEINAFKTMQDYYATALHEIAHSTGHSSRLNRGFDKGSYAIEELRAELASVFMQMDNGITIEGNHFNNHSAYLAHWFDIVKNDNKIFLSAVKDAMKISDYVTENYAKAEHAQVAEDTKEKVVSVADENVIFNRDLPFSAQVDLVLSGKNFYDDIKVCDTPQILLDCGCQQLPMLYSKEHLRNAVKPKSKLNSKHHGLSVELIKSIPKLIDKPAMIFNSISKDDKGRNSLVLVLNAVDNDNAPILVTILPNGVGRYEININSNYITSIYGKDNQFERYINRVIDSNSLIFWDKKMSQDLFSCQGLQLPEALNSLNSNTIIRKASAFVNTNLQNNENILHQEASSEKIVDDSNKERATEVPKDKTDSASAKPKWESVQVPSELIGKEYGTSRAVNMPDGAYKHFKLFVSQKLLKEQGDGTYKLLYDSTKENMFTLKNDGLELALTPNELADVLNGKVVDKKAIRVRPSKRHLETVQRIEDNIPNEMKEQDRWVLHKKYVDQEKQKIVKQIFNPNALEQQKAQEQDGGSVAPNEDTYARCNDQTTWCGFEKAKEIAKTSAKNIQGLTYVIGDGISCIDLDHCFDENGKASAMAVEFVKAFKGTYIERSMSGTGLHIFVKGDLRNNNQFGNRNSGEFGDIEVYDDNKFMSLTGDVYGGNTKTLTTVTAEQQEIVQKYLVDRTAMKSTLDTSQLSNGKASSKYPTRFDGRTDDEVIEAINKSKKASEFRSLMSGVSLKNDHSRDDASLFNILAYYTNCDRDQMMRIFQQSALFRHSKPMGYYTRTMDFVIRNVRLDNYIPTKATSKPKGNSNDNTK